MTLTLPHPDPFFGLPRLISHAFASLIAPFRQALASFNENEDSSDEPELVDDSDDDPGLTLEEIQQRQKKTTEKLFGNDDPDPPKKDDKPKKEPKKEDKPPAKKEAKVKDTLTKDEDTDDDEEENSDTDYEADDDEEEESDNEDDEDSDDEEEESDDEEEEVDVSKEKDPAKRETLAQQQLKVVGRKAKKLETDLTTANLRIATMEESLREAQTRIAEYSKVRIDPKSVPEYQAVENELWAIVDEAVAEDLPKSAAKLSETGKFNSYMKDYLASAKLNDTARTDAIDKLRERIVKDLGDFEYPYTDLIDEEKARADKLAKDVLKVLKSAKPKAEELIGLHSKLNDQAKSGRLDFSASEHARLMKEFAPTVEHLGKLDDKLVEESPYAPEALVTQLAKKSPKLAQKLEDAKRDTMEVVFGLKPLTSAEYDKLEEQGVDISEYLKERNKAHAEKRKKLLPLLVRGLFTASITRKALEGSIKKEREEREAGDEVEALDEIERDRKKKVEPKVKTVKKKTEDDPRKRPIAISKYFDHD